MKSAGVHVEGNSVCVCVCGGMEQFMENPLVHGLGLSAL